jgi:purine-nucleoside phosphorylase
MHHSYENIVEAAEGLKRLLPADFVPEIGIICGSGLSGIQQAVTGPRIEVSYSEIKGFPVSTGRSNFDSSVYFATLTIHDPVHGHAGVLVFGFIGVNKTPVVLMNGRAQ